MIVLTAPTGFGAEPEGFVYVIVFCRGTPAVAIVPAWSGASIVLLSHEGEGEFTGSAFCVAAQGEEHCKTHISIRIEAKYKVRDIFLQD